MDFSSLFVSLILTVLSYCAFPLLFSHMRNSVITKAKYRLICYLVNFFIWILFAYLAAISGGTSSGAAYLFWTWVFTSVGIKQLEQAHILDGVQSSTEVSSPPSPSPAALQNAANKAYINSAIGSDSLGLSTQTPFFFSSSSALTGICLGKLLTNEKGETLRFYRKCGSSHGPAGSDGGYCIVYEALNGDNEVFGEIIVNDCCDATTCRPPVGYKFIPESPYLPPTAQAIDIYSADEHAREENVNAPVLDATKLPSPKEDPMYDQHHVPECNENGIAEKPVNAKIPTSPVRSSSVSYNKVAAGSRKITLVKVAPSPAKEEHNENQDAEVAAQAGGLLDAPFSIPSPEAMLNSSLTTAEAETPDKALCEGSPCTDQTVEPSLAPPCHACGAELFPESTFCHICGTLVEPPCSVDESSLADTEELQEPPTANLACEPEPLSPVDDSSAAPRILEPSPSTTVAPVVQPSSAPAIVTWTPPVAVQQAKKRAKRKKVVVILLALLLILGCGCFLLRKPLSATFLYSVSINGDSEITTVTGKVLKLSCSIVSHGPSQKIEWRSSAPDVVSVSSDGTISALSAGTAKISVLIHGVKKDTVRIKVEEPNTTLQISQSHPNICPGDVYTIKYTVTSNEERDIDVEWVSENPEIATVLSSGKVCAVSPGKAVINAYVDDVYKGCLIFKVSPKAVSMTNGQMLVTPRYKGDPEVTINAPKSEHCVVYFKHRSDSTLDFSFYVKAGTSVTVNAPAGTYDFYYVSGITWYGPEYKFGDDSSYYKSPDVIVLKSDMYSYSILELTLYKVTNGNMETTPINEGQFPM